MASNDTSLITSVSVINSHHISDHSLIKSSLTVNKLSSIITFRHWRPLRKVDFSELDNALHESELIQNPTDNVDDYVRQIDEIVLKELDKVAPLKTSRRVQRPLPCDMFLSSEAVEAKRQRRRLERLWKRTDNEDIRQRYRETCREANKKINESRSNYLSDKLKLATGNAKCKWKNYRDLLHCNVVSVSQGLGENVPAFVCKLATYFSDKIAKLHAANSTLLAGQSQNPLSHDLPFIGDSLSSFTPVTPTEV